MFPFIWRFYLLFFIIFVSETSSTMNLDSQQYVDLLFRGLKVVEGIPYPKTRILHNRDIHSGCTIISVTKVLNGDLKLPYPLEGADTLQKQKVVLLNGVHLKFYTTLDLLKINVR